MALALPYLALLKNIPWNDVVKYAPHVYEAATSFTRWVRRSDKNILPPTDNSHSEALSALDARLLQLEQENAQGKEDISRAADLISSLAEQNTRLVEVVDLLQTRTRYLMVVSGVLCVGLVVSLAAALLR